MEFNKDKIVELSEEQFKAVLSFIGVSQLKKDLIANAGNFPNTSNYYIGPKLTGQFWSGFRKEKLPDSKVIKFYIAEVLQNKTKLDVEFFYSSLEKKIKEIKNFNEDFILNQENVLREALCIIFDVKIDESTQKYINEIENLKKQYDEKIKALENSYLIKIEEKNNEIIEQKNEYENLIKNFKKQISEEKVSNEKEKNSFITGIIEKSIYTDILSDIKKLSLENYSAAKEFLLQSFNKNLVLLEDSAYTTLAKELTIQYIITKILEEK